jgi:hypothetical protein
MANSVVLSKSRIALLPGVGRADMQGLDLLIRLVAESFAPSAASDLTLSSNGFAMVK